MKHPLSPALRALALSTLLTCLTATPAALAADAPTAGALVGQDGRPAVTKFGTVGIDLCETSPFVFKDKLYRLEGRARQGKKSGLRIVDHATRQEVTFFAESHMFPCVMVEDGVVHVFATDEKGANRRNTINHFTSTDLQTWTQETIFREPKMRPICNTTVCKADGRYVMSVETAESGAWGSRFMESKDLKTWTMLPKEFHGGKPGRLYSPHFLRHHDGQFYLFATVHGYGGYNLVLHRSADLKTWEASPFNPVFHFEEQDKVPFNPDFTEADKKKIAEARNIDNSDIDFCTFQNKLVINYCWGNQVGKEFVSEAEYAGTEGQFLTGWFPKAAAGK